MTVCTVVTQKQHTYIQFCIQKQHTYMQFCQEHVGREKEDAHNIYTV